MNGIQETSLAYEMHLFISDGWTVEEAREEIKAILETEYKAEIKAEMDEEILYGWDEVISDILASIEATLKRMEESISVC